MSEEIKNVVVGIERYRCRIGLDNRFYTDKVDKEFILRRAEEKAAYDLLDGIRQFIKVSQHLDRGYIEAEIFLPYVKDGVMKKLENYRDYQDKVISRLLDVEMDLKEEVRLLKRPWWKEWMKRWLK